METNAIIVNNYILILSNEKLYKMFSNEDIIKMQKYVYTYTKRCLEAIDENNLRNDRNFTGYR